ncbi:MAG: hypothetical protein ABIH24_00725 [Verrucomicrobiota bacterium]
MKTLSTLLPTHCGKNINTTCKVILAYLKRSQDFKPGEYYGSFWSEKAYHGPLLDYHAGGSHHHRSAGSAGLALWEIGKTWQDDDLMHRAEWAFDWLTARQRPGGGYWEIQNNEKPSDWERTGLEECSTIETAFVVHGLGNALQRGLPPKKAYLDCLQKAAHWQLSLEWPAGSGVFPHHERSPYDTLNANLHAAETMVTTFIVLKRLGDRPVNLFYQGARRSVLHTLELQWPNGCFPYGRDSGSTINYTALVLWCLLNILDILPAPFHADFAPSKKVRDALQKAAGFLRKCVNPQGRMRWESNETSTAKHNLWTYLITFNVLMRIGGNANRETALRLLKYVFSLKTSSGLLPMRDRGEPITDCAYMQADILLFLLSFADLTRKD